MGAGAAHARIWTSVGVSRLAHARHEAAAVLIQVRNCETLQVEVICDPATCLARDLHSADANSCAYTTPPHVQAAGIVPPGGDAADVQLNTAP